MNILAKDNVEPFAQSKAVFENLKSLLHYNIGIEEILSITSLILPGCNIKQFVDSQLVTSLAQFVNTSKESVFKIYDYIIKSAMPMLTIVQLLSIFSCCLPPSKLKISNELLIRLTPLPRISHIYLFYAIGPLYVTSTGGISGEYGLFFNDNHMFLYSELKNESTPDYSFPLACILLYIWNRLWSWNISNIININ